MLHRMCATLHGHSPCTDKNEDKILKFGTVSAGRRDTEEISFILHLPNIYSLIFVKDIKFLPENLKKKVPTLERKHSSRMLTENKRGG